MSGRDLPKVPFGEAEWNSKARGRSARARSWCATTGMFSTYLFGALCPDRAVGAALVMPCANTEAMNEHLKEISINVAPGPHAVLVCDGAGWHQTGGRLHVPGNITLLRLPPYSPELNPMENVWHYRRENKLCATVWNSYDACVAAWQFLINDPDRIRSIGTREWACVSL